jgi:tetratricopeptide (TPR) repeat protein
MDGGGLVLRQTEEVARISKGVENKEARETAGAWGRKPKMIDNKTDGREARVSGGKSRWMQCGVLGAVCALVIGLYSYVAHWGSLELITQNAADTYYNLLVQGFRAGQLGLRTEAPPELAKLADPYDPVGNARYRPENALDMSYYKGKLYLYFGVTPALILFWPFVALTGHYLFHRQASAIFCGVGFLASVWLLRALWRRYFAEVSLWVVAACMLALGLATGVPVMLTRPEELYGVPISCGYMLTMLTLGAIWCALHEPDRRCRWLVMASVAYGLAVGARPNLLFGAVILLVPVAQAWRERRQIGTVLTAATAPILLIGLGLMLYNARRFDNPLEFGMQYALGPARMDTLQMFNPRYLGFNFRVYFLEPVRWGGHFPFVHGIVVPPVPPGHLGVQKAFGVLSNVPLVWLALTVPLVWRGRSAQGRSILQRFLSAVSLLVGICALTLCLFLAAVERYEVDFLPALVLLAVVGILGLERALAPTSGSGLAEWPVWRRAVRWGWGILLGFSVAFNLLSGAENYAETDCVMGNALLRMGRIQEAIGHYEQALRIKPDYAEAHNSLGVALGKVGKIQEAIGHYEQALRIKPDFAEAHNSLGVALEQVGKIQEAIRRYEQALRFIPDYAEAHNNLGVVLWRAGRIQEAIEHYEQAVRIKPDLAEAHNNLGVVLAQVGRIQEAIGHCEQALRIKPDYAVAHNSFGVALGKVGKIQEAIGHYEQALRIKPDYAEAHYDLGFALEQTGKLEDAIGHYEQAVRIKPDFAVAHCNMGTVLEQTGKVQEAIGHYQQALRINPDLTAAKNGLARLQAVQ